MEVRAIILAAGRGSRMGQITDRSHKCLTFLNGKPLLQWQLEAFQKAGVDNILVVRGHNAHLISGNFQTVENPRWAETNMVSSLFCAPPFKGRTIISYSDIVYKPDYIVKLANSEENIEILADLEWKKLWGKRFENLLDDAETFKSRYGRLTQIGGKTIYDEEIEAQYIGLLSVSEEGWRMMADHYHKYDKKEQDRKDMTTLLSDMVHEDIMVSVSFINGGWCEVDHYNDVMVYEKELENDNTWMHDWRF